MDKDKRTNIIFFMMIYFRLFNDNLLTLFLEFQPSVSSSFPFDFVLNHLEIKYSYSEEEHRGSGGLGSRDGTEYKEITFTIKNTAQFLNNN